MSEHLQLIHVELRDANALIEQHHRHHKPVVGHRFSVACKDSTGVHGVAVVGRPVARACDLSTTVEVTRLVTDGTPNACSFLYSACARAAKALGYTVIQTYILDSEPGTSLLAAGWVEVARTRGGHWNRSEGRARRSDQPEVPKKRFEKRL